MRILGPPRLRSTTSRPACIISVSTSSESVAGPTVATILVRLNNGAGRSATCALHEYGDRRQGLALHELQECTATGRDVGDAVLDPVLLDGGQRVAAAGERKGLAARYAQGDGARAFTELRELEHPHRPVPDDGAGVLQQRAAAVGAVRPDVENHVVGAHLAHRTHVRVRRGG